MKLTGHNQRAYHGERVRLRRALAWESLGERMPKTEAELRAFQRRAVKRERLISYQQFKDQGP